MRPAAADERHPSGGWLRWASRPALDPRKQVAPGPGLGGVDAMVDPLGLEAAEDALHGRVVEAFGPALAARLRRDPGGVILAAGQDLPVRLARMSDPAIRVTDQARDGLLAPDRRVQRLHRDPGRAGCRAWPSPRSRGCADRGRRREGGRSPRCARRSSRRARPGRAPPPRSRARSGWARWMALPAVGGAHPQQAGPHRPGHPVAPDPPAEGAQGSVHARRPRSRPWTTRMASRRARLARLLARPGRERRACAPADGFPGTRHMTETRRTSRCSSPSLARARASSGGRSEDERGLFGARRAPQGGHGSST